MVPPYFIITHLSTPSALDHLYLLKQWRIVLLTVITDDVLRVHGSPLTHQQKRHQANTERTGEACSPEGGH